MYNAYDVNQQKTDDLRVLKGSASLTPTKSQEWSASDLLNKTYQIDLPDDYLHILNCIVEYNVTKNYKCYTAGGKWQQGAKRATADMLSQIIHNYYLRPSYKNPYFYINNINISNVFPTSDNQVELPTKLIYEVNNTYEQLAIPANTIIYNNVIFKFFKVLSISNWKATYNPATLYALNDIVFYTNKIYKLVQDDVDVNNVSYAVGKLPTNVAFWQEVVLESIIKGQTYKTINNPNNIAIGYSFYKALAVDSALSNYKESLVNLSLKEAPNRYGNKSKVRLEIRYGKDDTTFQLSKVYIDYLKSPQFIRLTQEQIDEVDDVTQILEFPDYVCQEIVNELIKLLMENASDPRLQSHIPVNQSIAQPGQEQQRK